MDLILAFAKMFGLLTVFALPLFFIYSQGHAYSDSALAKYFLGNMGGASVYCAQFPIQQGTAQIACPAGTHFEARDAQLGILNSAFEDFS